MAHPEEGTTPLNFFWSSSKADNYLSTDSSVPGYTLVRVACHIWTSPGEHRVPLDLYFNKKLSDHWSLSGKAQAARAQAEGYTKVGVQGYLAAPPSSSNASGTGMAMDLEHGVFYRRRNIETVLLEDRWYASYDHKHILAHELEFKNSGNTAVAVPLQGKLASFGPDINFSTTTSQPGTTAIQGRIIATETNASEAVLVAVVNSVVPDSVTVEAGQALTLYVLTSIATSLDGSGSF